MMIARTVKDAKEAPSNPLLALLSSIHIHLFHPRTSANPTFSLTLFLLLNSPSFSKSIASALISGSAMSASHEPQLYCPEPWRLVLEVAPLLLVAMSCSGAGLIGGGADKGGEQRMEESERDGNSVRRRHNFVMPYKEMRKRGERRGGKARMGAKFRHGVSGTKTQSAPTTTVRLGPPENPRKTSAPRVIVFTRAAISTSQGRGSCSRHGIKRRAGSNHTTVPRTPHDLLRSPFPQPPFLSVCTHRETCFSPFVFFLIVLVIVAFWLCFGGDASV